MPPSLRVVDTVGAGQHVPDETFMPRNVHDPAVHVTGQAEMGEAQVDRNAALLFLLQPVGVGPGEKLDERGLAVVDVTGGADDGEAAGLHGDVDQP